MSFSDEECISNRWCWVYRIESYKDSVVKVVNEIKDDLEFDRHIKGLIVFRKK